MAVAAVAAAGLGLAGGAHTLAAKPQPVPDRVLARGSEFDLVLSKQRVRPGRVIVQFLNEGEDPHDLRLARVDATGVPAGPGTGLGVLGPGDYENLDTRLRKRSAYRLWCSLSDHRALGMEATLRTKKRKRRAGGAR